HADQQRGDDRSGHLAVELLDPIRQHIARVRRLPQADSRGSRAALGEGVVGSHGAENGPAIIGDPLSNRPFCPPRGPGSYRLLPLRITPTAMPSIVISSRRRSSSMGSKSGFSGSNCTEWPRRFRRFTVTSSAIRATTTWPLCASCVR